jgi:ADP-ribose pyrophosphatase YjhB (NUDIX family)
VTGTSRTAGGDERVGASAPIFCSQCGGPLVERFVDFERRSRAVCAQCGSIAYRNPRVLVSTIVAAAEEVLLCRRAVAPAAGRWAPPGGFLECDEALEEAAARETFEETGISLNPRQLRLHAVSTLPEISEVYVGFLAEVSERPELVCGLECAEVRFFREDAVPWADLAYPDIGNYLRRYFRERRSGEQAIYFSRLDAAGVSSSVYRISAIEETMRLRAASTPSDPTDQT